MDWVGLPAGVRFDPSDEELLRHLAAKVGHGSEVSHPLIDDFISHLDGDDGICQTHPENLPGKLISSLDKVLDLVLSGDDCLRSHHSHFLCTQV